jgi:ferric-dicitrate binding protein FerR (iron transport regulator)
MTEQEKIDSLIIACLDDSISGQDAGILKEWLQSAPENLQYFTRMKEIWDAGKILSGRASEQESAMKRFYEGAPANTKRTVSGNNEFVLWFRRIAAVFVIVFATYTISVNVHQRQEISGIENTVPAINTVFIPKGQKGQLLLSDGTKIWLNSGSTLEYPSSFGVEREVSLSGEAYFEVKSDEQRPFYVHTENLKIKVTGTSFNIKAYADDNNIETTLVEGRLSILKNDTELLVLNPNESAVYSITNKNIVLKNLTAKRADLKADVTASDPITPVELVTVWKEDKLIFRDEPLGSMTEKMERWFNRKIHVSDPKLLDNKYNGKFVYNETIYQVLDVICRSDNLKYKEIDYELYIYK